MICAISNIETTRNYKSVPLHRSVSEFARWYRDKLNIQQKQKGTRLIDLTTCLNTFIEMKKQGYAWERIQNTLLDELLNKDLLTDKEWEEKRIS